MYCWYGPWHWNQLNYSGRGGSEHLLAQRFWSPFHAFLYANIFIAHRVLTNSMSEAASPRGPEQHWDDLL